MQSDYGKITDKHYSSVNKTKYFLFLDELRESGTINMFGAVVPLYEAFQSELTKTEAKKILTEWMLQFKGD